MLLCYADNGFHGTGVKALAKYFDCTSANLYTYFESVDDLIIQSTAYCMCKVENDFMEKAPTDVEDLWRFIGEIPYWTAEKHSKKYRLMYMESRETTYTATFEADGENQVI